jgi:heme/copper-type cytochrome/quinol oxidase subunit 2
LIIALFWLAVVCCVVAQIEIVRSALKAPVPRDDIGRRVPTPPRWTEIMWTVLPAIGLIIVLVATWNAIQTREANIRGSNAISTPTVVERPS